MTIAALKGVRRLHPPRLQPSHVEYNAKADLTPYRTQFCPQCETFKKLLLLVILLGLNDHHPHITIHHWLFMPMNWLNYKRFEVLTEMVTYVAVFWLVIPCSDVVGYQLFGGLCCLHSFRGSLVSYHTTIRCHKPGYCVLYIHYCENFKSRISYGLEDGGSQVVRNVGILPHQRTASQPGRPRLGYLKYTHTVYSKK
jgi:hypothetical protein